MPQYLAKINNETIELEKADAANLDAVSLTADSMQVARNLKNFHAEDISVDINSQTVSMTVNGREYTVSIMDEYDQLVEKMGLSVKDDSKAGDLIAPMPGLVLDVMVKEGDELEKGTPVLILEAMKMENVLKAEGSGIVQKVVIQKGAAVGKGEVLIEIA